MLPAKADLVDINTATQAQLDAVKGIGPATAKKIIDNRPYTSLDDLKKAGLSAKEITKFKPFLTLEGAAAPAAPTTAATPNPPRSCSREQQNRQKRPRYHRHQERRWI